MTLNYLEMTELEEDYTGLKRANLVTDELHTFDDPNNRIFAPDLGQFYINKNFQLVDDITGRILVRGEDYELEYYSKRVFEKSGLDNAYLIHVNNTAITAIRLTYQGVGGLYTSPAYLIQLMMERYPEGIGPIIYWKNVLFKPDQFKPASHRHHSSQVYGLSPTVDALERVRGGMAEQDRIKFGDFYDNTLSRFNELMNMVNNGYNGILATFQETRKGLELQQGDFIYTDSNVDQATLRKYGKWKRHTNTMLSAGGPSNAGTSMSVGSGVSNPIRQTNLFQRIDDPWGGGGDLEEMTLLLQPDKTSFNEGDTVTIQIVGLNIPPMTMITGSYVGLSADNVVGGDLTWQATLDAYGKATIQLKTVSNGRTTGNIEVTVLPAQFATSAITILMIDTSKTPVHRLFFSSDAQGLNVINRVNEGSVLYMNLVVTNPLPNQELSLNYSAGTISQADFITPLPSTVTIPSNGIVRIRLELANDERAEGEEVFVVALLPLGSIDLGGALARSEIIVVDSSYQAEFNAVFSTDTGGVNRITEVNEGQTFYLYATTSLRNGTEVTLEYGGTMQTDDFIERPTTAVVSGGLIVAAITTRADARSDGDKILGLTVKRTNGVALANLSLIVRDTSQAPEATIFFADRNGGLVHVNEFNEGQTIFITIDTRNVENGTFIDLSYTMDGAITQADINKEFTAPLPIRAPVNNNRVIIAATILEDYKADRNRNFRCTLDMSGVSANCIIRDTSVPIVTSKFSSNSSGTGNITEANEGQTVYLVVETKGYAPGSTLNLNYTGTMTDEDFTAPRPLTMVVTSTEVVIIPMSIKNDFASEGIEKMTVTVRSGASVVSVTELNVRDTSLTPVLDLVLSLSNTAQTSITSIGEGVTAYVHINWTNLPIGTRIDWQVVNETTVDADFDKSGGNITNQTYIGTGFDTLTTKMDHASEGGETFRLRASAALPDGRTIASETGTINLQDTSLTEEFSTGFSSDALGNTMINSVDEGSAVYFIVRGTNIPNATKFNLSLPSTGLGFVNDADVDPAITNTVLTMNNNFISHRINILADRISDGDETLVIRTTRQDTNVPRDSSLVVRDTSKTMSVTFELFLADGSVPPSYKFIEGDVGYLQMNYFGGSVGDRIRPMLKDGPGNAVITDFTTSEFGVEKVISSASGSLKWNFTIKNDRTSDGDKNFVVTSTNLTSAINYETAFQYKIIDTSKTTTYRREGWYDLNDNPIFFGDEDEVVQCQVLPVDGVIGDVYRLAITGGTATLNQDFEVNMADVIYNTNGMTVKWPFKFLTDRITEDHDTIICTITNTTTGQLCGPWSVFIRDTSKTPTAALGYWDGPAAFGGNSVTIANEGQGVWFRLGLVNQKVGDKWRISIAPNSGAQAADIDNFVTKVEEVFPSTNGYIEVPLHITAEEVTEGNENLIMQVELQAVGTSDWVNKGSSTLLINDTSKTPTFDIYYSSNSGGTDRLTNIGEGSTIYLIAKTTNVATGTVLQVGFAGSTVDSNDFTTAPPYEFPSNINTLVPMVVQANGIAFYRFDIKADLTEG